MALTNIRFQGGSEQQKQILAQAHQKAIAMAQKAQEIALQGGDRFEQMFGHSDKSDISKQYSEIAQHLRNDQFLYNLDTMLPYQFESELVLTISSSESNLITILSWDKLFLQENIEMKAALSLLFNFAPGCGEGGLADVNDFESAIFLAKYNPAMAAKLPRNYMYFARSSWPAPK